MAIYHLEAQIVSRGTGRSAVAAAAYMSCSKILNDYDGVLHDFTRKRGLIWAQTFLPENAPPEWADRSVLWNAVEEAEKTKDSRLAREFVVALPIEMDKTQWIDLLTEFIQTQFVSDGMCADAAIHDTDGHNPHAHILLTVRPLNPDGTWQYKTQKEYLCIRGKEERGFTAEEFKTAQAEGWEKQYQYQVLHYRSAAWQATDDLRDIKPDLTRFDTLTAEIKAKTAQQRTLTSEKKQTPAWSLLKKRELTQRINALTEELEDLRTEKNRILASFDFADDKDMNEMRRWTKQQEATIKTLNAQKDRCEQELNHALEEYEALSTHAAGFDLQTLWPERLKERESLTNEASTALKVRFGADYSEKRLSLADQQVREMMPEEERELRQYWKEKWQIERENRKSQDRNRSKDIGR